MASSRETPQRSAELWGHFPLASSYDWNLQREAEGFQTKAEEPQKEKKKKRSQDLTLKIFPIGKVLKVRPSLGDTSTQQVLSPEPRSSSQSFVLRR